MGKISKKLKYKKNNIAHSISLYSNTTDVGSNYLSLRVDGAPAYAQLSSEGSVGNSDLRVRRGGVTYAVNNQVEDPGLVSDGGSVVPSAGFDVPAPIPNGGTYTSDTSGVWTITPAAMTLPTVPDIKIKYTATINPHTSLSEVHHYRLKYGDTSACSNDGGTILAAARVFTLKAAMVDKTAYFKAIAEDASNNVLFESGVVSVPPISTTISNNVGYYIQDIANSDGSGRTNLAKPTGSALTHHHTVAKRWYYVGTHNLHPTSGAASEDVYSQLVCADTCICNINYSTCSCGCSA